MWSDDADYWRSRPRPTAHWTENTMESRGFMYEPWTPEESIASLLAWSAVAVAAGAAVVAGAMLAGAKWFGGDR